MIDADGYPTEETLKKIRDFDPFHADLDEFIEYLMENWMNGFPPLFDRENHVLYLSTAGWSGCESIIKALQDNFAFWALFWHSTARGGHYVFKGLTDRRKQP